MEFLCCNNILKTSDNASSARNEGSAGLGGRIRAVVTSQKHLSHNNAFQYIQMVNVPAGGAGRRSPVLPPGKCLALWLGCAEVFSINYR